jgi:hypothetical protein
MDQIKSWYTYRHKNQKHSNEINGIDFRIEKPNEVLVGLLSDRVESSHKPFISKILEEHLPHSL